MGGNAMKVIGRSRRIWFAQVTALASTVVVPQLVRAQTTPLVDLPERGFRLLSGGAVFAGGAVALPGFEIVHAVFKPWVPLEVGYAAIASHLESVGRPLQALCGMELRLPRQLSVEEFQAFNGPYVERLVRWGLMVEGRVPVPVPELHRWRVGGAGAGPLFRERDAGHRKDLLRDPAVDLRGHRQR